MANLFTQSDLRRIRQCHDGGRQQGKQHQKTRLKQGNGWCAGSVYRSFLYQDFENAFLAFVSELKVSDVLPVATEKNTAEDQLEAEEAKLVDIDARLKVVKKRVSSDPDIEALMDVLTDLSNEQESDGGACGAVEG